MAKAACRYNCFACFTKSFKKSLSDFLLQKKLFKKNRIRQAPESNLYRIKIAFISNYYLLNAMSIRVVT